VTVAPVRREDLDEVAVLVLDSPGRKFNVVDAALLRELGDLFDAVQADPDIAGVIVTSGKAGSFGAGADIDWLPTLLAGDAGAKVLEGAHDLMRAMAIARKPVVAAIYGFAFGGALEIALACDAIAATPRSRLGLVESTLGLIPGGGGTQLIHRWTVPSVAAELLVTGSAIGADEGHRLGLVTVLANQNELSGSARALVKDLAAGRAERRGWRRVPLGDADRACAAAAAAASAVETPPSSTARDAIVEVLQVGFRHGPAAGLAAERAAFLTLLASAESRALRQAFKSRSSTRR
jgi:3-hydroxyacyl-CoA dehydrogenase/enoyl-CoA hydratase/3-hydroxybutyryl-CoA epimerase